MADIRWMYCGLVITKLGNGESENVMKLGVPRFKVLKFVAILHHVDY